MKKLILPMAVIAAMTLASCGNQADKTVQETQKAPESTVEKKNVTSDVKTEEEVALSNAKSAVEETESESATLYDKARTGTEKAAEAVRDKSVELYDKARTGTEKAAEAVRDKSVELYDKARTGTEKAAGAVREKTESAVHAIKEELGN